MIVIRPIFLRLLIWKPQIGCHFEIKRFKHKTKWAKKKGKAHSELAMEYFDTFHAPIYGKLWPSIRVALLSKQKYCALVNNYSQVDEICLQLQQYGAENIISNASRTQTSYSSDINNIEVGEVGGDSMESQSWHSSGSSHTVQSKGTRSVNIDSRLDVFMPVQEFVTGEGSFNSNSNREKLVQVEGIPHNQQNLPHELKVFAFNRGDVSDFPSPLHDEAGLLGYYLLDAASILPVVALDLRADDKLLDLCAAPGGKTLAMLQTVPAGNITCNDSSQSRLKRLKDILRWYFPNKEDVTIINRNGKDLREMEADFTKVLVDAPCSSDRHMVMEDDNNLFKPSRNKERTELPNIQRRLLMSAIKLCKPGGSVVYSTCTLSPSQNDGVVQAAIEELMYQHDIDAVVQDLKWIADKFRNTFSFYGNCRYGQQVIPCLTANFGPMYFSKIVRK